MNLAPGQEGFLVYYETHTCEKFEDFECVL